MDSAISAGRGLVGVPTSISPAFIAALTNAPAAVGAVASAMSLVGLPLTMASIANMVASLSPTSITSLQAALANPEAKITEAQARALVESPKNAMASGVGGPQPIGIAPFDNPVTNVAGTTQAAPTTPAVNFADMFSAGIFGDPSTARSDIGGPGPTGPGSVPSSPGAEGPVGLGEGGPPGGPSGTPGGPAGEGTSGEGPGTPDF